MQWRKKWQNRPSWGEKMRKNVFGIRPSAQCFILFGFGQEFSFRCIPSRRKADVNPFFDSRAIFKFNGVHIKEIKDKRCILLTISSFQDQRPQYESVQHQHWKDMFVLLLLMKMIVC